MSTKTRDGSAAVLVALGVAVLSALGVALVYGLGGNAQLEGLLLGLALGGLGVALILLAKRMLPGGHFVQVREDLPGTSAQRDSVAASFWAGAEPIERRSMILKAFGLAVGALGVAAVFPIRSLGTSPGRSLFRTEWKPGMRVITRNGDAVRIEDVDVNTVLTVFPEGHPDSADSQTLLIRLPPGVPAPGPATASVDGVVAFSKVCTHAGCPVGIYQAATQELFCPCHQSTFSVRHGAKPTFGPATRALPQLPIGVDNAGYVIARGDFPEPVGPGFWNRGRT